MADRLETFTERFNRLTASMSRKQIGQLLDLTDGAVRKLQEGITQSLKAHGAIILARRLGVSVEYLAERGPLPISRATTPLAASGETGLRSAVDQLRPALEGLQGQLDDLRAAILGIHPELQDRLEPRAVPKRTPRRKRPA